MPLPISKATRNHLELFNQVAHGYHSVSVWSRETTQNELGSFGINSKAKYAVSGKANREEFNEYSKKTGPIKSGEKVDIRGGGPGIFQSREGTKLRILLKPWDIEVVVEESKARMRQSIPELDKYERKPRKDKVPQIIIDNIDSFHQQHNQQSPNKKDIAIRRHPYYPMQVPCCC